MSSYAIDGQRLKSRRVALRKSPATLAKEVGCTDGYIRLLESNKRKPSLEMLGKLEQVLGITAKELGADLESPAEIPEQPAEREMPAAISAD